MLTRTHLVFAIAQGLNGCSDWVQDMSGFTSSFYDRVGNHQFQAPTKEWGYWPQLNEWSRNTITWNIVRIGGADHQPVFEAYPICKSPVLESMVLLMRMLPDRGEELRDYTARGPNKKTAIEAASQLMATSGHCVGVPRDISAYDWTEDRSCVLVRPPPSQCYP